MITKDISVDGSEYKLTLTAVSYTHLRAHETRHDLVCRLLLEKIKEIYSEDPLRVKHIRNSIVKSLQDEKMIFRIYDIAKNL